MYNLERDPMECQLDPADMQNMR